MATGKRRLDTILAQRGLFASRSRAAVAVMAGEVRLGADGRRASKPSEMVEQDAIVTVRERRRFVSRGGVKLANALSASGLEPAGRHAIDVGASTGGFTDCLLSAGVAGVIAIDVAYGQFDYGLRNDERVHVIERVNARALTPEMLPWKPDLAVVDVSFISLRKVLPALLGCLTAQHDLLALVKPQFEVGRANVGKGGVVRDAAQRRDALIAVGKTALELGEAVRGFFYSGLPGPKGNRESFIWIADAARGLGASRVEDVMAMAERVEPSASGEASDEVEGRAIGSRVDDEAGVDRSRLKDEAGVDRSRLKDEAGVDRSWLTAEAGVEGSKIEDGAGVQR